MPDGLLDRGHEQLVDRAVGAVGDAVEPLGQPAAHVQAQHLRLDVRAPERRDLVGPVRDRVVRAPRLELLHRLAVARHVAELGRFALVAHDGHRQRPTLARLADHVGGRHARAVEQHLAELAGDPVDHLERTLLDAGLVHRHRERGDALVLRHVGIGAGEQQAPVGDVGVAGPDLVPVDDVLVAVAHRARAQRREVGAGVGFAEALAPAVAPADQRRAGSGRRSRRCRAG